MPDSFTLKIPCKRYVKCYLENSCGNPVNLKHLPEILDEFESKLVKKVDITKPINTFVYPETSVIIIPSDSFYRYGWKLDRDSIVSFNHLLEQRIKFIMRQYISVNHAFGYKVTDCIVSFQEKLKFPEHVWSFDSIKKDFDRHSQKSNFNFLKSVSLEIRSNFLKEMQQIVD